MSLKVFSWCNSNETEENGKMIKMDFSYPDYDKYEEYIKIDGNINFLDAMKFERTLLRCSSCSETMAHSVMQKFYYLTKFDCGGKFIDDMAYDLVVRCNVPKNLYKSYKNTKGYSFDKNVRAAIVEWLAEQQELTQEMYTLREFFQDVGEKSTLDYILSSCRKSIKNNLIERSSIKGWDGIQLYLMHNIYYQQKTGRYYAREMPIVGLPQPIRACITAPDGYFLMGMDLRQIDLSVGYDMYLRGCFERYDKIFDEEPEDKYIAMYKIVCDYGKTPADIEYYKKNRAGIKTNILAGLYQGQLQTLNSTLLNTELNMNIVLYYEGNEGYQNQVRKIQALYELGIAFSVKDAFGFPMDIEIEEVKSYGSKSTAFSRDFNKVARDCISYVTQSTSNSIKVKWLVELMGRLEAAGCTDDEVWACMDRHDEVVFTIATSAIKYMPIFKDCEVIKLANWCDVRFKTDITLHYNDEMFTWNAEEKIVGDINEAVQKSLEGFKLTVVESEKEYTFRGIPNVHDVYVSSVLMPTDLYKELFGEHYIFLDDSPSEQDSCAAEIERRAEAGYISKVFQGYTQLWDKFVLRNSISSNSKVVHGLNSLPQVLAGVGVEFVRIHTMYGDGFSTLGDCYGMKSSLNPEEVVSILQSYGN